MSQIKKILLPIGFGLAGIVTLGGLYFGLMSWAEGFQAARGLFWYDRWFVIPIIIGFGVQAALYVILKFRLFIPNAVTGASGALMGASGGTSSVAMLACCVHHITDVLPILGLTAATTFLARYRHQFMWAGLGMTIVGIAMMLITLLWARSKTNDMIANHLQATETS